MSSEYLGWTEHKPSMEFDATRFDRNAIAGGPASQDYESLVRGLFRPNEHKELKNAALPPSFTPPNTSINGCQKIGSSKQARFNEYQTSALNYGPPQPDFNKQSQGNCHNVLTVNGIQKISNTAMRRVEEHLGKDALDETCIFKNLIYPNVKLELSFEF